MAATASTSPQAELAALETTLQRLVLAVGETPSSTVPFSRNLSLWMTGDDVKALQEFLIGQASGPAALKLKAHGATTVFGSLTFNALVEFQEKAGIVPASGFFGPITRAHVNAAAD
jgi:murein L,D-transpeptidase YcbB/YkuD